MDEKETIARDTERLEELDKEIKEARQHLDQPAHEDKPEFYEDDETPQDETPKEEAPSDSAPGDSPG